MNRTNYCIGIVDEDRDEVLDIKRTIIANRPEIIPEDSISFCEFDLMDNAEKLIDQLYTSIKEKIESKTMDAILIDYKIIISTSQVEGTALYKRIKDLVPKFPALLLTNVTESCYEKRFVDADKVYSKHDFFQIETNVSKEKVFNLFRNIDNYRNNLDELLVSFADAMSQYKEKQNDQDIYSKVINLDIALSDYLPQEQSAVEKRISIDQLKDAVALLQEASNIIGGKCES